MTKSSKYDYEITSDLKALDMMYKRLQDLNQKEIQYGYFEDNVYPADDRRAGKHVASVAIAHETGFATQYGVGVPRPFFTQSLAKARWFVTTAAPAVFMAAIEGKQEKNFVQMAKWLRDSVKDTIDEQQFAPLSDYTISLKRKEGVKDPAKILVETGVLRGSVQAKIVNNDAYGNRKKEVIVK